MTTIYIVRHAEVEYPYDDEGRKLMYPPETHISQEGRKQISSFAESLKNRGVKLDSIETSGFTRAVESANILGEILGTQSITVNPAFADSHIPGWFGIPLSKQQRLMDQGEDIYLNPRSPDQEPYEHIAERMIEGFHDLINRNPDKSVAIVSHGDPIRLLMYRINHPEGDIPNMSILSKEGYLKRGETFKVSVDSEGKVLETGLLSNLEGVAGTRELYLDNPNLSPEKA